MDTALQILRELMPVGIAALVVVILYLAKLYRDLSIQFAEIAKQQAEYMRQRVEIVERSTDIFERTIKHQEQQLDRLKAENAAAHVRIEQDQTEIERLLEAFRPTRQAGDAERLEKLQSATRSLAREATRSLVQLDRVVVTGQERLAALWMLNSAEAEEEVAMLEAAGRRRQEEKG